MNEGEIDYAFNPLSANIRNASTSRTNASHVTAIGATSSHGMISFANEEDLDDIDEAIDLEMRSSRQRNSYMNLNNGDVRSDILLQNSRLWKVVIFLVVVVIINFSFNIAQFVLLSESDDGNGRNEGIGDDDGETSIIGAPSAFSSVSSIAFGSCSAYDLREMHIWNDAIIPAQPDAWIWLGDMVYLDESEISCVPASALDVMDISADCETAQDCAALVTAESDWQASCNCSDTYISKAPGMCKAASVDHANERWIKALRDGESTPQLRVLLALLLHYCRVYYTIGRGD